MFNMARTCQVMFETTSENNKIKLKLAVNKLITAGGNINRLHPWCIETTNKVRRYNPPLARREEQDGTSNAKRQRLAKK